jgi:hypothetical protein
MIPPRLRTYADQRALDLQQLLDARRSFTKRLLLLLATVGGVILNLMRG